MTVARGIRNVVRVRRMMRGPMRPSWDDNYETLAMVLHHYAKRSIYLPLQIQRRVAEGFFTETARRTTQIDRVDAGGVPSAWISREDSDQDRVLLYLHGGGYSIGSIKTHRDLLTRLCRACGCRTLAIEYRLAPEHPFPAQLEDAVRAYDWLLDSGIDPSRVVVAGESAGGGLTASLVLELRNLGKPMPAATVLISPWLDLEAESESSTHNEPFDYVSRKVLYSYARRFVRKEQLREHLAAPLHADLHGLPPMLIQAGGAEVLLDDATRMAARAEAAGVAVDLEVWDDMIHAWHAFAFLLPQGREAIARIGEYVREQQSRGRANSGYSSSAPAPISE
jgi:monoterpene epsilon-lactone hydrolase